ncbi:glycosyltransferase family 2 protein [Sulfurovum sp.]|uniref:glycosyltransferase family 2 protein n=1 Tax=Sulfurovum sp. TaxID=1969726 RepID=UPI0035673BEA
MLEILIPTFNRASFLEKNLNILIQQIENAALEAEISITVSDNCSEDETIKIVKQVIANKSVNIKLYQQKENIGLEKNAIYLLKKSTEKFIMYLGDDDYLPEGYLKYITEKINSIKSLTCIIPGFSSLYSDGQILPARYANFEEKQYIASFYTVTKISQFGHQLSGLVLKRDGLIDGYLSNKKLRNIYPFIYFVAYNNLRGTSIYVPKFQVLVSQGNTKNWNYDNSGLLSEIIKNYNNIFDDSYFKRNISIICFMKQQYWRLRISKNPLNSVIGFLHLSKQPDIEVLTKLTLPFLYLYGYLAAFFLKIKKINDA